MIQIMLVLVVAVTTLVVVIAFILVRKYGQSSQKALREVAERTGAHVTFNWGTLGSTVSGHYNGVPFTCNYTPQNRSAPPTLMVTLSVPQRCSFTVRKRNWFDNLCTRIGLARSVVTGDKRFDLQVQTDTADERSALEALYDHRLRERLLEMFGQRVQGVQFNASGVSLTRRLSSHEPVTPEMVQTHLSQLQDISRESGGMLPRYTDTPAFGLTLQVRFGGPLVFLLIGGLVLTIVGTELYPTLFPSFFRVTVMALPYCLTVTVAFTLFVWLMVNHRTDRHVIISVVSALGIPAFYLITIGLLYFGNGYLDTSIPTEKEATILKIYTQGRGERKIRFTLDGKLTGGLDRPRGDYHYGQPVRLTVHQGRLDIPWVSGWRVITEKLE